MARELVLYCDESDASGKHYSNFYGGALVESIHLHEVIERLEQAKSRLGLLAEVKWQKISAAFAPQYMAFMDETFALVHEGKIKFRIMFTQNYFAPKNITLEQQKNTFFLLYYQFVKHAFGLTYAGDGEETINVRIYFDWLPDTKEKSAKFKGYVAGLSRDRNFIINRLVVREDQIAEVDSKEHVIMQALDVILGAMTFKLNNKHLEIPAGKRIRGNRTIAKEKVYKHIRKLICDNCRPGFNIGITTGHDDDKANRWAHMYRHWLFKAEEIEIKPEFVKKR